MLLIGKSPVLADHENVVAKKYIHWWIFVLPLVIFCIAFYLSLKAASKGSFSLFSLISFPEKGSTSIPQEIYHFIWMISQFAIEHMPEKLLVFLQTTRLHPWKWLSQLVFLYAFYRLFRALITFISTQITITDLRIFIRTGVFRPQIIEIPIKHIDAFHVKKSFFSQFLNVGTLIIQASGGLTAKIPAVKSPALLSTLTMDTTYDQN